MIRYHQLTDYPHLYSYTRDSLRKNVEERGPELNVSYPAYPVKKAKARKKPYIHKAKDYRPTIRYVRVERVKKGKRFAEELEEERERAKLREIRDKPTEEEKLKIATIRDIPKELNLGTLDFLKKFHVNPGMGGSKASDLRSHMDPESGKVWMGSTLFEKDYLLENFHPTTGMIEIVDLNTNQKITLVPSFDLAKYILMGMNLNLRNLVLTGQLSPTLTKELKPQVTKKGIKLDDRAFQDKQNKLIKLLQKKFHFA